MARSITPWQASEVAAITAGQCHYGENWTALSVSTDTRTLQKGDVFVALSGANFRGEDFVEMAREKGAVAAVVSERVELDFPQVVVENTLSALTALAVERRSRSGAFFIALTGSNGKTSTKEMLQRILSRQGQTLATRGNLNNEIGVPLTLLELRDADQYAVIEMGANHGGEIAHLVGLANPDVAVITNVAAAHLEGFGSLAGVLAAKTEIYTGSEKAMVINNDQPWAENWRNNFAGRAQKTFALKANADIIARDCAADGRHFVLQMDDQRMRIDWQLRGQHNIANALAACAAAACAGVSMTTMAEALNGLQLQQSRLSAVKMGPHTVYDDTYNANPASFKAGIDVLSGSKPALVIAGAMAELGADSARLHAEIAEYAQDHGVTAFWSLKAPDYGSGRAPVVNYQELEPLVADLRSKLQSDAHWTVLIKGSRSAKMERVLRALQQNE